MLFFEIKTKYQRKHREKERKIDRKDVRFQRAQKVGEGVLERLAGILYFFCNEEEQIFLKQTKIILKLFCKRIEIWNGLKNLILKIQNLPTRRSSTCPRNCPRPSRWGVSGLSRGWNCTFLWIKKCLFFSICFCSC